MEFKSKIKGIRGQLKEDWQIFWEAIFQKDRRGRFRRGGKNLGATHPSIPWLSQQRQRLNQRLEEIQKEADSIQMVENPKKVKIALETLHDEGQEISEKVEEITEMIGKLRETSRKALRETS